MKRRGGKGQVWIETVIYTLIAFAMMGLVLAYARPKIEEMQDKAIIEQSISMIKDIELVLLTMGGAGNQRIIEIQIKKGDLKIEGVSEKILFEMESRLTYSEPSTTELPKIIKSGNVEIETKTSGKFNKITLTDDFSEDYNITFALKDEPKTISKSPVAYTLKISNLGVESFFELEHPCTLATECTSQPESWFVRECSVQEEGDVQKYCRYTSKRATINFELV